MQGSRMVSFFKLSLKMSIECLMCCFVVFLFGAVKSDESFARGVTLEKKLVDSDTSDIFNKTLASKDSSKYLRGVRTPPTPATRVMPSYSPPSRALFTPPLPPALQHPFADKPTLRGSNSDGSSVGSRRPIPPPPPFKLSPEDMIPIRPPDLVPHDTKKKTLNTPSLKKVAEPAYSETSSTTTSNTRVNETFDFVPILPYPSVSRILSGGSGRKHDVIQDILERTRLDHDKEPRTIKQEIVKSLIPPAIEEDHNDKKPEIFVGEIERPEEDKEEVDMDDLGKSDGEDTRQTEEAQKQEVVVVEKNDETGVNQADEPWKRLGIAWDIHVYLIATLFAILALCSLINIIRLTYRKHLLSHGYFISLHGILLIIGCLRSFFLFYDAYNVNNSFSKPVSNLLLNMVYPLLTSAFAILFLFLLTAAEVKALNNKVQKASFLGVFIIIHIALSVCVHLYSVESAYSMLLPLICRCVFIVMCVGLGLSYLYVYKSLSQCCVAKGYGECGERWSVSHAVRVTLATAMLSLLMAAVHLYGMLGVYDRGRPQPWYWWGWGFQLSVRVIEVSMCGLLAWAGMQRAPPPQPPAVEDMYPAICTANQAYTLRSNKHYDDTVFPLNSLQRSRRAGRLHAPASIPAHSLDRRLQPSPSMLVAENGFVRFRTLADAELPDDPYPSSAHQYA